MNKHLLLILLGFGSIYSVAQEKILVLKCTDIDNDAKLTWDVVINDVSKTITFYDRVHSKNYKKTKFIVSAERVKTYTGNTTYYDYIKYDFQSKLLIRTTTQVPLTENHPRLKNSVTDSKISKCKRA